MEIVTEIQLDPRNYRIHSKENKELIKKSLTECGAGRSVLVDKEGKLIAGNGVFEQAKALKIPTKIVQTDGNTLVVVQRTDLATADKKRQRLAVMDNSASDLSVFDNDKIRKDFPIEEIKELGVQEVEISAESPTITEDEVPDAAKVETRVKKGDIWQLGEHRLMCGDSTVQTDVERLMAGEKADLLLTDPPYNVAYEGKTKEKLTIQNDKQDDASFLQFLTDCFVCAFSFLKDGASFYIWHADSEGYNFRGALKSAGFVLKQTLIWVKNTMVLGRQDYQWKHEPCLYGWKEGAAHKWYSDRKQTTVLEFDKPNRSEDHPTMKPVALFAYQLCNSTQRGGLVLDLFGGSGTSIIASEQSGRKCYTMELDPHYCDVIIKRWENLTGKEAKLCK